MRSREIGHINEALLVLKHFIDLSARLLPYLHELEQKRNPSFSDKLSKRKIIDVYEGYKFETATSEILLHSNVLELIKETFEQIIYAPKTSRAVKRATSLKKFLSEHNRLKSNWYYIESN